jgi:hypothetical protein
MRITTRTTARTVAAVFMAAIALAGVTTKASAATGTDGFTILHASDHDAVHTCLILGTDDDYHEAIVCVDINTMTYDGEAYAQAEVEAYCQTKAGADVQCANITAEGEYANATLSQPIQFNASCGHQHGSCPTGREYLKSSYDATSAEGDSSCGKVADSNAQVWAVALGIQTTIELPGSDDSYTLAGTSPNDGDNESTGHYYVCY